MRSQKIKIEDRILEFQLFNLGVEKILLDSELMSEKKIGVSSWHIFKSIENGEEIEYRVQSSLEAKYCVSEVFRNGEQIYQSEKSSDRNWLLKKLLLAVVISLIVFFVLK